MSHYTPTTPMVSVLMASHDAEKTVRRCVESLQGQTLNNFELIVVDTGSSDGTVRQLDALSERDMRIEAVHADGCSRAEALDLALGRARGTYVLVMDEGGWADRTMLEDLVGMAEKDALEMVVGGFALTLVAPDGRRSEAMVCAERAVYPLQHDFRAGAWELFAEGLLLPTCAKLFSRALLEECGARFSVGGRFGHSFVLACLGDVERVGVLGESRYHVTRRLPVASGSAFVERCYHRLDEGHTDLLGLYRHWGLEGDAASMEMLQNRYVEQLASCIEVTCGRRSRVPSADQRRIVAEMIDTDRAQVAASVAHPRDNAVRALLAPIRAHNASLICVQTRLLSLVRPSLASAVPDLFV